jgi:transposase
MDVMVSRCAGIDIGKAEVVVCLRVPGSRGKRVSEVRTFSTVAGEINRLADWLTRPRNPSAGSGRSKPPSGCC